MWFSCAEDAETRSLMDAMPVSVFDSRFKPGGLEQATSQVDLPDLHHCDLARTSRVTSTLTGWVGSWPLGCGSWPVGKKSHG